jgi:hypothetical protein
LGDPNRLIALISPHSIAGSWCIVQVHRQLPTPEPIGFVPPAEAEAAFYAKPENTAVAA